MDLIAANAFVVAINNRNVQRFVRLARPTDVPSAVAIALEVEIQERSQASEDPYRRPTYTDVPPEILLLGFTSLQRCFGATTAKTLGILLITALECPSR
ncbi:hypothetical protein MTO96_003492 [Rhipicephalus appendiculatus]